MKKKLVMILMAVMVASATLGGCGQKGAETGTSVSAEEEDVQISYKELMKATDYKVQKYVKLNDYMNMTVELSQDYSITDEQIQEYIEYLLSMYPEYETTDKTTVENGDIVNIDYVGKVDGEEFNGGSATGQHLEIGSGSFIDGFEDGLIGKNVGDTVDLNLTFPDSYSNTDLAGKDVVFTVTLNNILPELSDDIVKILSDKSETVEEYKKEVKDDLQATKDESYESSLREAAWNAVLDNTEVKEYPEDKVQEYIDMMNEQYETMASYYNMEFEDFLTNYMQMDQDTYDEKVKEAAEKQVKSDLARDLLLDNVKKIDTSDEARQSIYEYYAEYYGYDDVDSFLEAMENADNMDKLEALVKLEMVQNWVADNCKQVESKSDSDSKSE